ncbi:MAG: glycosyltransferase family 4 protein [Acidobacteria bacterium]|nr:glycosyltransferase family 4 protein [Acidobacteriota bacterium]
MEYPSNIQRIVVADAQVPFIEGGAELHVKSLIAQLRRRGYDVEKVAIPFRPQAKSEILAQAAAWRLLDLSASNEQPIDLLIATRFPSYFARHPRKVAWVIHQHRTAYELCGTPYSDFEHTETDVGLRHRLLDLDRRMLRECRHVFTNARNTAGRLEKFNGVTARALYHPPPLADRLRPGDYGTYVLVIGRLEAVKRPDLAIRALAHVPPPMRLVIVGEGSQRSIAERAAAESGIGDRIVFAGAASSDELVTLYSGARAVVYVPFDEDYGYVTLEAFLSVKPVVTATDSGGTLEFVRDGENGFICAPEPAAIGQAIARLAADPDLARRLGQHGLARAAQITWDGVVEQLVG